ncbi:hypothetical protein E2C01_075046 [Portunus trituberculatus]|uniref:Uncharacterized protein n=1 Tax=Portunus trituberculatus TaxID=210409 RepID=A0A5B7IES3_PORTR|nr:hypothetical protein [Portunus trituberculatus]
MISTPSRR